MCGVKFQLFSDESYENFLLTEYENISKAYFDSKNSVSTFFRYYILIMTAPLTILAGLALKAQQNKETIDVLVKYIPVASSTSSLIGYFVILFSLIGFFIICFIESSGLTTKIYAAQVNAIRQYYQLGTIATGKKPISSLLPSKPEKPKLDYYDSLNFIVLAGGVFDCIYMYIGISFSNTDMTLAVPLTIAYFIFHIASYMIIANKKFRHNPRPHDGE